MRTNSKQLVLDGPANDLSSSLRRELGQNFIRWQVQLDAPVQLDAYDPHSLERMEDLAYAFMDDLEASDSPYSIESLVRTLGL
jgi:hypothetical protein